jgi:alpha-galactosidase/6-phospho-beta-glucosidase family protein
MKLAIVGGGGFGVPLVYGALLDRAERLSLDEVVPIGLGVLGQETTGPGGIWRRRPVHVLLEEGARLGLELPAWHQPVKIEEEAR